MGRWVDLFYNTVLTGNPTAPTPASGDNDTSISTTAFVQTEISKLTVATFSALATTAATAGQIVKFSCHTTPGDLGGGDAEAYAAAHSATDGGLSINSATTGIRFRRINYTFVTPEMFGVNTANAGAGFTAALAAGVNKFIARGTYTISTSVVVPDNSVLDLRGATINHSFAGAMFNLGSNVTIYGGDVIGLSYAYRANEYAFYCAGTRNGAGVAPTRKTGPRIYGTKFRNIGETPIELRYTTGGMAHGVEVYDCGYAGILGLSSNGFKVFNIIIDGLTGETVSGELNAYGVTFTHDNSSVDLVRDPVSANCSVNGFDISNIRTWHALDTHAGSNISFKNGRVTNCRRAAILTFTTGASPEYCEISDIDAINTLPAATVNSNGTSVHGEAFWVLGTSGIKANTNTLKNLTTVGHGTRDSTLGSVYLLHSNKTKIYNVAINSGYYSGMSIDNGNTNLDIDGFYVNDVAKNAALNVNFGITCGANNVTGTAKNLNIKSQEIGVYGTGAGTGLTVLDGDVSGTISDYDVTSVWSVNGHKERGTATATFTASSSGTQAIVFSKKYKNAPKITGLSHNYRAGAKALAIGHSAISNTGMTIVLDTVDAGAVSASVAFDWEVEGD